MSKARQQHESVITSMEQQSAKKERYKYRKMKIICKSIKDKTLQEIQKDNNKRKYGQISNRQEPKTDNIHNNIF